MTTLYLTLIMYSGALYIVGIVLTIKSRGKYREAVEAVKPVQQAIAIVAYKNVYVLAGRVIYTATLVFLASIVYLILLYLGVSV